MSTGPATCPEVTGIPAAQYIRMSTEHQQYSTENQSDVVLRQDIDEIQSAVGNGADLSRHEIENYFRRA